MSAKTKKQLRKIHDDAMRLAWQIEKCGCSKELTDASDMASALLKSICKIMEDK